MPPGASLASLLLLLAFVLEAGGETVTTSFDFPRFDSSPADITFLADASSANGSLELNKDDIFSYGRAIYTNPIRLWDNQTGNLASFTTNFSFSVIRRPNMTDYADGLAFFLAPPGYPIPENSTGGSFSLFNGSCVSQAAKVPVVVVEFDTFQDEGNDAVPHVGIDLGCFKSIRSSSWQSLEGQTRATINAVITYDAGTTMLRAIFSGSNGYSRNVPYVVDLRNELPERVDIGFAGATGAYFERHVIHSWSFNSSLDLAHGKGNTTNRGDAGGGNIGLLAGVLAGAGTLAIVGGLALFFVRRRRAYAKNGGQDEVINESELDEGKGPRSFSYSELARATRNFAPEEKLGRGGFGDVYRGILNQPKMVVAIKRVAKDSRQGKKEYVAEVKVISRVRHRNLVQLVGWCHEKGELLLAYEYMPNGSLDAHLYNDGGNPLPWPTRYSIARGVAAALLYLHEESEQCVVHRDVKSSNVMLDVNFNAKLGDFGLARLVDHGGGMETTAVAGTMGYLAPETATTGRASKESDVYSFGVLALEIACGRRPIDHGNKEGGVSLVDWVWDLYGKGAILEAADKRLGSDFDRQQMERLMVAGLCCAHPDHRQRPSMRQVTGILLFEMPLPNLPTEMPEPSYGGVSVSGFNLTSMNGWSSSTSGTPTGFTTGASVNLAGSGKPHLYPVGR
ncbi:unnamed protein product [Spirodela intermedia]|uniref:Protein kinase domain-containing protein n=1 Tax=Spirodela intermedia TaxID=51605 RepID=A0A7I8KRF5_SPIIN|nr:unnamed protein product [Spirodela intermedia]